MADYCGVDYYGSVYHVAFTIPSHHIVTNAECVEIDGRQQAVSMTPFVVGASSIRMVGEVPNSRSCLFQALEQNN